MWLGLSALEASPAGNRTSGELFQLRQHLLDVGVGLDLATFLCSAELALEVSNGASAGQPADGPELVDEQDAVQVIDLVLPDPGSKVAQVRFDEVARQVHFLDGDWRSREEKVKPRKQDCASRDQTSWLRAFA